MVAQHKPISEPGLTPAVPAPAPGQAIPRPAGSHPLLEDLKAAVVPALESLLDALFRDADDELYRQGEQAAGEAERRRCIELMRALTLEKPKMLRAFAREVGRSFNPLAAEAGRPTRQPGIAADEQVALTHIVSKAKQQHRETLADLQRRIEHAVRGLGVPLSVGALAPSRICAAFGTAVELLDADAPMRMLLYPLFERTVMQNLAAPYGAALQVLERHGVRPAGTAAARSAPLAVDARTLSCLEALAAFQTKHSFADALLGAELLAAARAGSTALGQRIVLVGQLLNEMQSDAHLPAGFARAFEQLRYPLLKAALADPGFFLEPAHALRVQLDELAMTGLCARLAGAAGERAAECAATAFGATVEVAASFVQPLLPNLPPLTDAETVRFLESQREQLARRRDGMLLRVRRMVAQELEVQTLGVSVPAAARPLLRAGMGPLLAVQLLRHGRDAPAWQAALSMLGDTVASLEPAPGGRLRQMRSTLCDRLRPALLDAGLADDRVRAMLDGLRAAHESADGESQDTAAALRLTGHELDVLTAEFEPPAELPAAPGVASLAAANDTATPADPRDLLRAVLQPGRWFRVFDPESGATQWLKVASYYPAHDSVGFTGFDREKTLKLRGSRVLEDLAAARTEPIDPTREMSAALNRLRAPGAPAHPRAAQPDRIPAVKN